MSAKTLYDKIWDLHQVRLDDDGTALLYIDRHLVHEVTSPQAFEGLEITQRPLLDCRVAPYLSKPSGRFAAPSTARVQQYPRRRSERRQP